ncbi:MAG: sulfatase-like hydrolase/transferase [Acidobacteria bacterium]|nr:sulfatase-like hydrolase/transferase [Acidobacteriota bacterium]
MNERVRLGTRMAACFAFGAWCFLSVWVEVQQADFYLVKYSPLHATGLPALGGQLTVSAMAFLAWGWFERSRWRRLGIALFLASALIPLQLVRYAAARALPPDWFPVLARGPGRMMLLTIAASGSLLILALFLFKSRPSARWLRRTLLYSCPLLAAVIATGMARRPWPVADYQDGATAALLPANPDPRVVWILFDEMSQAIAFDRRPQGLALPNLDRMRNEGFYATRASAPGAATIVSVPSLITGREVTEAVSDGPRRLWLKLKGEDGRQSWEALPNIFDAARQAGRNPAVVGWYHPYCRLFSTRLAGCEWTAASANGLREPVESGSLFDLETYAFRRQASVFREYLPGSSPGRFDREQKVKRMRTLLEQARRTAANPAFGLVLLHLPTPHPPGVYDPATGRLDSTSPHGYADGLALADRTLGEIREALEQAGLAERTSLLVSSDHGWRTEFWRGSQFWTAADDDIARGDTMGSPFLLSLPGQKQAVRYDAPFNTIVSERILMAILAGRLTHPADIASYIDSPR